MKILNIIISKFSEIIEKIKGARGDHEQDDYETRVLKHRQRAILRIVLVAAVILAGTLITKTVVERWKYSGYTVISEKTSEDTATVQYVELDGNLLKYNGDGATLLNMQGKALWSESYDVESPAVDVCGQSAVIYSRKGTQMVMVGLDGKLGSVEAKMPILKAKVASQGVVAAILEDGENTWINYYSTEGEQIATAKTRIDSPGYPVDLDISPNGMLLMITYFLVDSGMSKSYVAFYNFGNTGQNQMDNMVSGYTYSGVLVPQVSYLSESLSVSFQDDGFTVYKGNQIPKENGTVSVEKEIVSTFCSEKYIGLIFNSDASDKQYTLQVYNTQGGLKLEEHFNMDYNTVKISGDSILMYNENQLSVFSMKGIQKFNGTLGEGNILNVFKTGANRYRLVTNSGIKTIKLK